MAAVAVGLSCSCRRWSVLEPSLSFGHETVAVGRSWSCCRLSVMEPSLSVRRVAIGWSETLSVGAVATGRILQPQGFLDFSLLGGGIGLRRHGRGSFKHRRQQLGTGRNGGGTLSRFRQLDVPVVVFHGPTARTVILVAIGQVAAGLADASSSCRRITVRSALLGRYRAVKAAREAKESIMENETQLTGIIEACACRIRLVRQLLGNVIAGVPTSNSNTDSAQIFSTGRSLTATSAPLIDSNSAALQMRRRGGLGPPYPTDDVAQVVDWGVGVFRSEHWVANRTTGGSDPATARLLGLFFAWGTDRVAPAWWWFV